MVGNAVGEQDGSHTHERRGESEQPFLQGTQQLGHRGDGPVRQRWLLQPDGSIEPGHDPVTGLSHVLTRHDHPRFMGATQTGLPKVDQRQEEGNAQREQERDERQVRTCAVLPQERTVLHGDGNSLGIGNSEYRQRIWHLCQYAFFFEQRRQLRHMPVHKGQQLGVLFRAPPIVGQFL